MEVDSHEPYQLSASLCGHEQDVRTCDALDDGAIVTGSRDATVRIWRRSEADSSYTCSSTLQGHSHYVQRVCVTAGGLASCSNDKHIIEWDITAETPARILDGHTDVVSCVVSSVVTGLLYSASWDKTARVWKDGACVHILRGHEAALWAVLPVEEMDGHVLTASGDRTYAHASRHARPDAFHGLPANLASRVHTPRALPGARAMAASNYGLASLVRGRTAATPTSCVRWRW